MIILKEEQAWFEEIVRLSFYLCRTFKLKKHIYDFKSNFNRTKRYIGLVLLLPCYARQSLYKKEVAGRVTSVYGIQTQMDLGLNQFRNAKVLYKSSNTAIMLSLA